MTCYSLFSFLSNVIFILNYPFFSFFLIMQKYDNWSFDSFFCYLSFVIQMSYIERVAAKIQSQFEGTLTRTNRIITCARVHFPHENKRIADLWHRALCPSLWCYFTLVSVYSQFGAHRDDNSLRWFPRVAL